jgi:carboxyl-terminal processing protease
LLRFRHVLLLPLVMLAPTVRAADDLELYASTIRLIRDRYYFPEKVQAGAMLGAAARRLAAEIEWLLVRVDGNQVELERGDGSLLATVETTGLTDLPLSLQTLEDTVARSGEAIPSNIDLGVEILRGAVSTLDRPSTILTGDRLESFDERLHGVYEGIGVETDFQDGEIVVERILVSGPAARADVRAGDVILAIDGVSTMGMDSGDANDRIRGPVGTHIALHLRRGAAEVDVDLVREQVQVPNVSYKVLPSGVAYIDITHFSEQTVEFLRRALSDLASQGALDRGIILDLRGNTGGSMIQAARSADQFLLDGLLVRTEGRDEAPVANLPRELDAADEGTEPTAPLVLLVDHRSASGSEILAGALSLLDRAILVGERTYGKGTVQKIYTLRAGLRLKLTVAEYRLAKGVSVAHQGLEPDVAVGKVIFDANGVRFQEPSGTDARVPVLFAQERPGWQEGVDRDVPETDEALALGERIVLHANGSERDDLLASASSVLEEVYGEEDRHLVEAFATGGIDWRAAPQNAGPTPPLDVSVDTAAPVVAGDAVELRATVHNPGSLPVYRARVVLHSDNSLWDQAVLPIGYVPPGATLTGRRTVRVPAFSADRTDDVIVSVELEGQAPPAVHHEILRTMGRSPPDIAVRGALVPLGDHLQARLYLANRGQGDLHDVRVRFAFPGDGVRLLDREGFVPAIEAGQEKRVDLDLQVLPSFSDPELPLSLLVDAAPFGHLGEWNFPMPRDGRTVRREAPAAAFTVPVVADAAVPLDVTLQVTDDGFVDHATVFVNGDKVLYRHGGDRKLDVDVHFTPVVGTNEIDAWAVDGDGLRTHVRAWVLGQADGVASEPD